MYISIFMYIHTYIYIYIYVKGATSVLETARSPQRAAPLPVGWSYQVGGDNISVNISVMRPFQPPS